MKIYVDQGVNQKLIKQLRRRHPNIELINGHSNEQRIKGATEVGEPFRLEHSYLDSGDFLVGDNYEKIAIIIGKDSSKDIDHLYTAHVADCDYFITNNPKDFIRAKRNDASSNEKREELEKILNGTKIITLDEFSKIIDP